MLTIITSLFTGAVAKWVLRRVMELGGLLVFVGGLIASVDPTVLARIFDLVGKLLAGRFEEVSVAAVIGAVSVIWGLIWNARSTFKAKPELPVLTLDEALAVAEKQTGVKHTFDRKR